MCWKKRAQKIRWALLSRSIETAWRRYTKHSRNKVQEIQGAVMPLAETFARRRPFLGAVLAGEFTAGSLAQLQSHHFHVAYCPYETVLRAFSGEGVDISSEENTPNEALDAKVRSVERLSSSRRSRLAEAIRQLHEDEFATFLWRASPQSGTQGVGDLPADA